MIRLSSRRGMTTETIRVAPQQGFLRCNVFTCTFATKREIVSKPTIIKKYGNRRLYDTGNSRYITLDELATKIQSGIDVRVVDAKSGEDLTQSTLTQIVIEGRGAAQMLPVPLLNQLIRLGEDALAEFLGSYLLAALDLYLQAKRGAQNMTAYNPFAAMPFAATDAMARMWATGPFGATRAADQTAPPWTSSSQPPLDVEPAGGDSVPAGHGTPSAGHGTPSAGRGTPSAGAAGGQMAGQDSQDEPATQSDVDALRRELAELKAVIQQSVPEKKPAKPRRKRVKKK